MLSLCPFGAIPFSLESSRQDPDVESDTLVFLSRKSARPGGPGLTVCPCCGEATHADVVPNEYPSSLPGGENVHRRKMDQCEGDTRRVFVQLRCGQSSVSC